MPGAAGYAPNPQNQAFVLSDVELGNWCKRALGSVFHRGVLDDLRKTVIRDHIDGHVFAWMLRTGRMTTLNVKGLEGHHVCKVREIFYADFPLAAPGRGQLMVYPNGAPELHEVKNRIMQVPVCNPMETSAVEFPQTPQKAPLALTNGSNAIAAPMSPPMNGVNANGFYAAPAPNGAQGAKGVQYVGFNQAMQMLGGGNIKAMPVTQGTYNSLPDVNGTYSRQTSQADKPNMQVSFQGGAGAANGGWQRQNSTTGKSGLTKSGTVGGSTGKKAE